MFKVIEVNGIVGGIESAKKRKPKNEPFKVYNEIGNVTRTATQAIGANFNGKNIAFDRDGVHVGDSINGNFYRREMLYSWDYIKSEIKNKYKRDKIIIVVNNEIAIYFYQFSLCELLEHTEFFQLNVKNNSLGIAFRHFQKNIDLYNKYCEKFFLMGFNDFADIVEKALNLDNKANFGNIVEYALFNKTENILDRFEEKKHDGYLTTISKNDNRYKYSVEVKSSLTLKCDFIKTSKSASVSNNFIVLEKI